MKTTVGELKKMVREVLLGDIIPGGLADDKIPVNISIEQIQMGIAVEMEHTDDPRIALEIVLDHLTENPEYYTALATIE